MKAVMISIKPKWCELIASGKKTIKVQKTKPKIDTPFKVYIYETKDKKRKYYDEFHKNTIGKVIGEFVCDKIGEAHWLEIECFGDKCVYKVQKDNEDYLTNDELLDYMSTKDVVYGWHISDLKIYDKPKELSEFKKIHRDCWYADLGLAKRDCPECENKECFVSRPPQSWCYVEEYV